MCHRSCAFFSGGSGQGGHAGEARVMVTGGYRHSGSGGTLATLPQSSRPRMTNADVLRRNGILPAWPPSSRREALEGRGVEDSGQVLGWWIGVSCFVVMLARDGWVRAHP